jgi:hypothetical protein
VAFDTNCRSDPVPFAVLKILTNTDAPGSGIRLAGSVDARRWHGFDRLVGGTVKRSTPSATSRRRLSLAEQSMTVRIRATNFIVVRSNIRAAGSRPRAKASGISGKFGGHRGARVPQPPREPPRRHRIPIWDPRDRGAGGLPSGILECPRRSRIEGRAIRCLTVKGARLDA